MVRGVLSGLAALAAVLAAASAHAGSLAYMPAPDSPQGKVLVFDPVTRSPRFPIPAGPRPCGIAMHPAGTTAYVPNCGNGTVTVIDTVANAAAAATLTIGIGSSCPEVGVAVHPSGNTGTAAAADFYAGLILPDGSSIAFLTGDGGVAFGTRGDPATFRPAATALSLAAPFIVTVPGILSYQWTGAEPRGEYSFVLLAMRAGTMPAFAGVDVLGLAVAPFAFP